MVQELGSAYISLLDCVHFADKSWKYFALIRKKSKEVPQSDSQTTTRSKCARKKGLANGALGGWESGTSSLHPEQRGET